MAYQITAMHTLNSSQRELDSSPITIRDRAEECSRGYPPPALRDPLVQDPIGSRSQLPPRTPGVRDVAEKHVGEDPFETSACADGGERPM